HRYIHFHLHSVLPGSASMCSTILEILRRMLFLRRAINPSARSLYTWGRLYRPDRGQGPSLQAAVASLFARESQRTRVPFFAQTAWKSMTLDVVLCCWAVSKAISLRPSSPR